MWNYFEPLIQMVLQRGWSDAESASYAHSRRRNADTKPPRLGSLKRLGQAGEGVGVGSHLRGNFLHFLRSRRGEWGP